MQKIYKVAVIGPTGVGKSQFCNYIQKDSTNSKNIVSDSLDSCTQDPNPNIFERQNSKFNFIDTAGNNDSSNNDEKNIKTLVDYLRTIKEIDSIFLLLTFGERLSLSSRDYLKRLGKIFTPLEFYNHLTVVFTKSGNNAKSSKKREKNKEEITRILKETFITKNTLIAKIPDIYFIDTEFDEDTQTFDESSQDTIDIMLQKLVIDNQKYRFSPIYTSNLDTTGINMKKREVNEKKEIELLKKKINELKLQNQAQERRKKQLEEEIKKNQKNEKERIKKEKELQELKIKHEEEMRKTEQRKKEIELANIKEKKLYEEMRQKKIEIDKLNGIIDGAEDTIKFCGFEYSAGLAITIGGALLSGLFPVVGPLVAGFGLGTLIGGGLGMIGGGIVYTGAKLKKESYDK